MKDKILYKRIIRMIILSGFLVFTGNLYAHKVTFSGIGSGTVTATVDGGAITSGADVAAGKNVVFTATPTTGQTRVNEWWKVNGVTTRVVPGGAANDYYAAYTHTIAVSGDVDVEVLFERNIVQLAKTDPVGFTYNGTALNRGTSFSQGSFNGINLTNAVGIIVSSRFNDSFNPLNTANNDDSDNGWTVQGSAPAPQDFWILYSFADARWINQIVLRERLAADVIRAVEIDFFETDAQLNANTPVRTEKSKDILGGADMEPHGNPTLAFTNDNVLSFSPVKAKVVKIRLTDYQAGNPGFRRVKIIETDEPAVDDATLLRLSVSEGALTPAFDPQVTAYTVDLPFSIDEINILVAASNGNASITGDYGIQSVPAGGTIFTVMVTAEDNVTEKEYTITVHRPLSISDDTTLSSLTVSAGHLEPEFDPETLAYTVNVKYGITSIVFTAETTHPQAVLDMENSYNLDVGSNPITITVTAEDETTTNEYVIDVIRAEPESHAIYFNWTGSGEVTATVNDEPIASGDLVYALDKVVFTATPSNNQRVNEWWSVNGNMIRALNPATGANADYYMAYKYTLENFDDDVEVKVVFERDIAQLATKDPEGFLWPGTGASFARGSFAQPADGKSSMAVNQNGQEGVIITSGWNNNMAMPRNLSQNGNPGAWAIRLASNNLFIPSAGVDDHWILYHFDDDKWINQVILRGRAGTDHTKAVEIDFFQTVEQLNANEPIKTEKSRDILGGKLLETQGRAAALSFKDDNVLSFDPVLAKIVKIRVTEAGHIDGEGLGNSNPGFVRVKIIESNPFTSSDATLKSLTLSHGELSPEFSADITSYTVSVPNSVSEIIVTGVANHIEATVNGNGSYPLDIGDNDITVTVTAEDGVATETYSIKVERSADISDDAKLKSLTVSNGTLAPEFSPEQTEYTVDVAYNISAITVAVVTNHSGASVEGDGVYDLEFGENKITVTVTAEDGVATKEYVVTVTRAEPTKFPVTFSWTGSGAVIATVDEIEIESGEMVEEGMKVVFTATPADGYRVNEWWTVNNNSRGTRIDPGRSSQYYMPYTYTKNALDGNMDVQVWFERDIAQLATVDPVGFEWPGTSNLLNRPDAASSPWTGNNANQKGHEGVIVSSIFGNAFRFTKAPFDNGINNDGWTPPGGSVVAQTCWYMVCFAEPKFIESIILRSRAGGDHLKAVEIDFFTTIEDVNADTPDITIKSEDVLGGDMASNNSTIAADNVISFTPLFARFVKVRPTDGAGNSGLTRVKIIETDPVMVSSIIVTGAGGATAITDKGGTLQMSAAVLPVDATNPSVAWTVTNVTGRASISESGLLTALDNGTVIVVATANDGSEVFGDVTITISNQEEFVPVSSITVTGASSASTITTDGGTLQMSAAILPADATLQTVAWAVTDGTGSATISESGLLVAKTNGTVTVKATANDGSEVFGELQITISGQIVLVTSVSVTGAGSATTISTDGGTLQMSAAILPADATDQTVAWSVTNGTGSATISESGLLTAKTNGTVTVRATAKDASGRSGELQITISGQFVPVASITVTGAGGAITITTDGGSLQMSAAILPADATDKSVAWSVTNGTGEASISANGLLTAAANGTVTVKATANDGSGVSGELMISISGQFVPATSITVTGAGDATTITAKGGTLQMSASVLPAYATNKSVAWSVTDGTGKATISTGGLLTAAADGTVTVKATANDGSGVSGELVITISGQTVTSVEISFASNLNVYPNPFKDHVRISGAEGSTLRVIDAAGVTVHIQKINGEDEVIRLEHLLSGVYFLRVEKNGQSKTLKIVKE